jgi:hypothetical protein
VTNWRIRTAFAWFICVVFLLSSGGCAREEGSTGREGRTGEARIAITNAPSDAQCARINAAGSQTVTTSFPLTPGQSTVLTMPGLPEGAVTFTADVFPVVCAAVTTATVPTWVSDSVTVTIVVGQAVNVTLTMHRPSKTTVTLDFPSDGGAGSTRPPSASEMVAGGQTSASQNFKMVYTFGQPTQNQDKSSSPHQTLRGGLTGANGSQP